MSAAKILTQERRSHFFDHVEPAKQRETLEAAIAAAPFGLLVSRMDRNVDPVELKKVCSLMPGKPKLFLSLARYSSTLLKRQVLIGGFDTIQDKRVFMNVFKMLFPEYLTQEVSKLIKVFCLRAPEEIDCDWKDFFLR